MITDAIVRRLATQTPTPTVVTVYLDVDGRHRPARNDIASAFDLLAKNLRRDAEEAGGEDLVHEVEADIKRMRDWLAGLDRASTRGVAMFSCAADDFFDAVPLAAAVQDEAAIGPRPRLRQLLAQRAQDRVWLVALVDDQHVRIARIHGTEASEVVAITEQPPIVDNAPTELGGVERRLAEDRRAHYRRAADAVQSASARFRGYRLLAGGTDAAVAALEHELPAPVAQRLVGRVRVGVDAPLHEIVLAARPVTEQLEQEDEDLAVSELIRRAGNDSAATVGLSGTLEAIAGERVAELLVTADYEVPGVRCPACGRLDTETLVCTRCGSSTEPVDDVVELAIDDAVTHGATIRLVRGGGLAAAGSLGAIERY